MFPPEPQENIVHFVEKYSPKLEPWQRELVRIVRKLSQYFYPQVQTKMMNEGWATFWHYTILNTLHGRGLVDDGSMLEFLKSHTNVVMQPGFDSPAYSGLNPYALGFSMMSDNRRIREPNCRFPVSRKSISVRSTTATSSLPIVSARARLLAPRF